MAAEEPLLLFHCGFRDSLQWHRSKVVLERNLTTVGKQLQQHLAAAALTSSIYEQLQRQQQQQQQTMSQAVGGQQGQQPLQQQQLSHILLSHPVNVTSSANKGGSNISSARSSSTSSRWMVKPLPHIPLLKRQTEPSMEDRFEKAGFSIELLNQAGGSSGHMEAE